MSGERLYVPGEDFDSYRRPLDELIDRGFDDLIDTSRENATAITRYVDQSLGSILGASRDFQGQMQVLQYDIFRAFDMIYEDQSELSEGIKRLVMQIKRLISDSQRSGDTQNQLLSEIVLAMHMMRESQTRQMTEMSADIVSAISFLGQAFVMSGAHMSRQLDNIRLEIERQTLQSELVVNALTRPTETASREKREDGMRAYSEGLYKEALSDFEASLSGYRYQPDIWSIVGTIYRDLLPQPMLERAREAFVHAGRFSASKSMEFAVKNYVEAAKTAYQMGDFDGAVEDISSALSLDSNSASLHFLSAKYAANAQDILAMENHLYIALKLDPSLSLVLAISPEFSPHHDRTSEVVNKLRKEAKVAADIPGVLKAFVSLLSSDHLSQEKAYQILALHEAFLGYVSEDTYLGYIRIQVLGRRVKELIKSVKKNADDANRKAAVEQTITFQTAIVKRDEEIRQLKKKLESDEDEIRQLKEKLESDEDEIRQLKEKLESDEEEIRQLRVRPKPASPKKQGNDSPLTETVTIKQTQYTPSVEVIQALVFVPNWADLVNTLSYQSTFVAQGEIPVFDGKDKDKYINELEKYLGENLFVFADFVFSEFVRVVDTSYKTKQSKATDSVPKRNPNFDKVNYIKDIFERIESLFGKDKMQKNVSDKDRFLDMFKRSRGEVKIDNYKEMERVFNVIARYLSALSDVLSTLKKNLGYTMSDYTPSLYTSNLYSLFEAYSHLKLNENR